MADELKLYKVYLKNELVFEEVLTVHGIEKQDREYEAYKIFVKRLGDPHIIVKEKELTNGQIKE